MLKQTDKLIEEYEKQKETLTESDYELIDELYHILLALNLKDKRKVNAFLNQPIYKTKYGKFICQEAKVKYFFRDSNN